MTENTILGNLVYNDAEGSLRYKGVRYLLLRPETLGKLLKAVEPMAGDLAGEALYAGGFTGGLLSSKTYQEMHGLTDQETIAFMMRMGREIGWGRFSLERYDPGEGLLSVLVSGSAFAEAYGASDRPVCHLIRGIVAGMGSALMGKDCNALETDCAAAGAECCRFVLEEA